MAGFISRVALGLALAVALTSGSAAVGPGSTDWPTTNFDQTANRYSPLDQITAANVRTLQQVWSFHLKPAGFGGGMREDEAIPLVIGNTMYVASPYGAVHALDATTGTEKWKVQLPNGDRPSKRGLAYWPGSGGVPPSIIFGVLSGSMYSIKASDGTPNAGFGQNGVINLKTPEVMQTGMDATYSLLSSPTIYKNLIIIGAGTGEGAGGSGAGTGPAGDTRAFDAITGKLVWTFHTVPRPGEFGYDTWKENSAKNRSGVNVWGYTSLDVERGILYMPIGAPNNDRVGVDRPGNNLFSSSVVAVDANTGKYLWHFQVVHHDIWDYDTQSAPLLVDLQRNGKTVPAVIISTKMGLMFTLNRVTGKPIFDIEERPVPKSDLPREQTSPTQPFPVKPPPLTQNTISRDNLYKGEPQHQSYCEHMVDDNDMKLGGPYMPISFNRYSISPPGPAGGINFWGASYDPKLHLFISNTNNIFQPMRLILRPDGTYINNGPLAGLRRFGDAERRLLCGPTPWGELVAVNMDTGDIAYRQTLGVSDMLPAEFQNTGRPSSGGVMLTASGLTFVGGTDDFRFRAFATATGDKLWEIKMPSSIETSPITYMGSDGRQFVTVVSTGGGLTGSVVTNDEIIAFALPNRASAAQPLTTTTAITNVTVIDVEAGRETPAQTVVINGDRIDSVGPAKTAKVPGGATVVDGAGKFLIPGLWDMHAHLFSNSQKPGTDDHAWHFPLYIATGVTGIRDMWTNLDEIPLVKRWDEEAAAGKLLAPRVMFTGPMINGADGGLRNVTVVTTPDEARRVVDTVKDGGGAAVKIHSRVPHDAYIALLARARERQIPVIGHLPASVTIREAITAGQHSIDHVNNIADGCASGAIETEVMRLREQRQPPQNVQQMIIDAYDQQRCEDLMRRLRDAGVWLVPTLVESRARLLQSDPVRTSRDELKYVPKSEREVWDAARPNARAQALAETRQRVYQQGQKLVGLLQRSGVPVMTGTDVSNPWLVPGFSVHDELALFVESGMTPAEALRAATLAPARFLGKTDTLGTVAAGKLADLVLLDANPLADIHNTLKIRAVVAGGRYVDRAALDALLAGLAQ